MSMDPLACGDAIFKGGDFGYAHTIPPLDSLAQVEWKVLHQPEITED